ncbi:hypothetical protein BTM25_28040 [Actinomadura rubteroloni]|uniref:Uncharacterized protein n=1 Tax=Actinomadura rubteroloni TaxID=1926885 RepID=A0A2P4UGI7_9ACTN|nr:hypothetical protein [Actinomadura rubteroloni]POM24177.1 hypothetical protein BTM25_28040 [Actinomadura rubteroloni]
MAKIPSAAVAASGLIGGYAAARFTRRRELGGVVLAAAGAWCAREWTRAAGPKGAAGLLTVYLAGFGGSHPLAKKVGAWPAVLGAAAVSAGASYAVADRRG